MKKFYFFLMAIFLVTSCYVYRPYEEKEEKQVVNANLPRNNRMAEMPSQSGKEVKQILEPNKFYKIKIADKQYKIEVESWEADSLICHIKGKPKKQLIFHKDDIQEIQIRHFSKVRSDLITVGSYLLGIVGLIIVL